MTLKDRIQLALKQERGLRLTAAEVQGIASFLEIDFPARHRRRKSRRKPSLSKEPVEGHVRWMVRNDLKEVVAIDKAAMSHPWTKDDFLKVLKCHNTIAMMIQLPKQGRKVNPIAGYLIYDLCKKRIDLQRMVVAPQYRLHSLGRQMMTALQGRLSQPPRTHIRAEVDEDDLQSLLFLRAVGFTAVDTHAGKIVMTFFWNDDPCPFANEAKPKRRAAPRLSDRGGDQADGDSVEF